MSIKDVYKRQIYDYLSAKEHAGVPPDEPVGIRRRLPCGAGSKETNREGAGSFFA